jgi:hypothetical protein
MAAMAAMVSQSSVARKTLVHTAAAGGGGGDDGDAAASGECATGSTGAGGAGAVDGPPGFRAYTTGLDAVSKDRLEKNKRRKEILTKASKSECSCS